MSSPFSLPPSCDGRNLPSPDGVRHAQVGEAVDDGDPSMHFGDLALESAREQPFAQPLEAIHRVLG